MAQRAAFLDDWDVPRSVAQVPRAGPQLLDRAFAILSLFSQDRPEWTTTEAARACDLPVPTAHRILGSLFQHRYVERDSATKRFRLGPAALELARNAREVVDLAAVSLPALQRLARETGETALLTVIDSTRDRSVCLERVESRHPLRLSVYPGRLMPLHAGASQKALLAHMPEDDVERVASGQLEKLWTETLTRPKGLKEDLATIRQRGWATSYEETDAGVWGIAITLLGVDGDPVAAIGLAGPRFRVSEAQEGNVLAILDRVSRTVADALAIRTSTEAASVMRRHDQDGRKLQKETTEEVT